MSSPSIPARRKLVVAALVIDGDRLLVTQRREDQLHPGAWEFPGGKIEPGESPRKALGRELLEEIGAATAVGQVWDVLHHNYGEFEVVLLVFCARLLPGQTAQCRQVADLRWVTVAELPEVDILPADRVLVRRLEEEGIPPVGTISHRTAALD